MSLQHPGVYGIGIGKGMVFWDASRGGVTYSHSQSELPREFRRLVSLSHSNLQYMLISTNSAGGTLQMGFSRRRCSKTRHAARRLQQSPERY